MRVEQRSEKEAQGPGEPRAGGQWLWAAPAAWGSSGVDGAPCTATEKIWGVGVESVAQATSRVAVQEGGLLSRLNMVSRKNEVCLSHPEQTIDLGVGPKLRADGTSFLPALSQKKKRIETPTGVRFLKISPLKWRLSFLESQGVLFIPPHGY